MDVFSFLGRGIIHEEHGKECQDSLSCINVNGRKIFVISDGCSSSAYAKEISKRNVDTISKIFSRISISDLSSESLLNIYPELKEEMLRIDTNNINNCFQLIFEYEGLKLSEELNVTNPKISDFCATLLFVIIEDKKTLIGHIGDGNIIFYDDNYNVVYRSIAENGEDERYTYFTLDPNFSIHFRLGTIFTESYESLVLFSDGPQRMFKLETGSIANSVAELVVKPIKSKRIQTNNDLTQELQKSLSHAMHYGFDDWSIIAAIKKQKDLNVIAPVSLRQMFYDAHKDLVEDNNDIVSKEDDNVNDFEDGKGKVRRYKMKNKRKHILRQQSLVYGIKLILKKNKTRR